MVLHICRAFFRKHFARCAKNGGHTGLGPAYVRRYEGVHASFVRVCQVEKLLNKVQSTSNSAKLAKHVLKHVVTFRPNTVCP